jgi:large conductance mechanosensitive channel
MKSFIAEFKDFAMKGNVLDLAVAVVVGAAFGKIVTSLVTDIITPLIGLLMGGVNFSGMAYTVGSATVTYGVFIQSVIDFLLVSLVIFLVVKALNKAHKAIALKEKEETPKEKEPPEDILLLREIRDSLKREE